MHMLQMPFKSSLWSPPTCLEPPSTIRRPALPDTINNTELVAARERRGFDQAQIIQEALSASPAESVGPSTHRANADDEETFVLVGNVFALLRRAEKESFDIPVVSIFA